MAIYVAGRRGRHGGACRRGPARLLAGLASVAAAALLAGAAGCADEPEVVWPADPTGGPTSTLDPAQAEAVEQILAAFDGFRRAEAALLADPPPPPDTRDQLAGYLADPLLSVTLFDIELVRSRGLAWQGQPVWEPTVTDLRLDQPTPAATVQDCLDATGWELVDRDSGDPAATDGLPSRFALDRYVMEFDATLIDGEWRFEQARVEGEQRC